MSSPASKPNNHSWPQLGQPAEQPPSTTAKTFSSPALVSGRALVWPSPQFQQGFKELTEVFFKVWGENYRKGEVGQAAIDKSWGLLNHYVEQQPDYEKRQAEYKKLLPVKPTVEQARDEQASEEGLAFMAFVRGGGL